MVMERVFRWNQWNVDHIAEHVVLPEEAELVVSAARRPWPEYIGEDKWRVWGQTPEGRYLQVIYIFDPPGVIFAIHARDLDEREKRQCRRRR
jgi:hypothetical protein